MGAPGWTEECLQASSRPRPLLMPVSFCGYLWLFPDTPRCSLGACPSGSPNEPSSTSAVISLGGGVCCLCGGLELRGRGPQFCPEG